MKLVSDRIDWADLISLSQPAGMALNMSDDEEIDFQRQHFQHPDDADDMDINSDSDGDAEQVISTPCFTHQCDFAVFASLHPSRLLIAQSLLKCSELNFALFSRLRSKHSGLREETAFRFITSCDSLVEDVS